MRPLSIIAALVSGAVTIAPAVADTHHHHHHHDDHHFSRHHDHYQHGHHYSRHHDHHHHEVLTTVPEPPVPAVMHEVDSSAVDGEPLIQPPALMPEGAEPIFAPPPSTVEVPSRRVYRRVRPRPRFTGPGEYDGSLNFYDDPHTVHYWSPNLPYYDPTHGYNSFRPLPPKSRHYRGPANPHNTGWGISY